MCKSRDQVAEHGWAPHAERLRRRGIEAAVLLKPAKKRASGTVTLRHVNLEAWSAPWRIEPANGTLRLRQALTLGLETLNSNTRAWDSGEMTAVRDLHLGLSTVLMFGMRVGHTFARRIA